MYRKTDRIYQAEKAFGASRLEKQEENTLRSGAKAAAEKPISNIDKNDKAVILARMHEIKKYKDDISSTQNTISYTQMFRDGVCQIDDHRFSKPFSSLIPIISLLNLRNKTAFSQSTAI